MDRPVNRARAKPKADSAAVPSVLMPSRASFLADKDPFDRFTHAKIAQLCGGFSCIS